MCDVGILGGISRRRRERRGQERIPFLHIPQRNGAKLETAQEMANHESARTTGLYDRRNDRGSLDEVERILI
jgi:hypothetical protein